MEDAPDVVSNMLRWLAAFAESEEVETVDIMAGYDLFNRLLLRRSPPPSLTTPSAAASSGGSPTP